MRLVTPKRDMDRQAEAPVPATAEIDATNHPGVAVMVLILLAGVSAFLWVPPQRGS